MIRGLYTSAFGMFNNQIKQDVTSNNIANSSTSGYKEDRIASMPFPEVMIENKDSSVLGLSSTKKLGTMTFGVESGEPYVNFKQGPLVKTGNDLDFAINGKGFFPLQYFDGEKNSVRYTRAGCFNIDGEGRIVNQDGAFLIGENVDTGKKEPIKTVNGKVNVDINGNLFIDSIKKYIIQPVDFNDYNEIKKYGNNMYGAKEGSSTLLNEVKPENYQICQGQVEQSNSDITDEMVNMITNLRNFQANQRVYQAIDETLSKAVNEVGNLK